MHDIGRFVDKKVASVAVYKAFRDALERFGHYRGYKRMVQSMGECGSYLQSLECVQGVGHDAKLVSANFCRARYCPMCAWRRGLKQAKLTYDKLAHLLDGDEQLGLVFVTLTLRNVSSASEVSLDRLTEGFKALRRRKLWKRSRGGVWAIEITDRGRGYHPHIHAICVVDKDADGRPWLCSQQELSDAWLDITGDSYIVGVEGVYGTLAESVVELCKYPLDCLEMEPAKLVDLYPQLYGRRFLGTWGVMRGLQLDDMELLENAHSGDKCSVCGGGLVAVEHLWRRATGGYVSRFVHGHAVGE